MNQAEAIRKPLDVVQHVRGEKQCPAATLVFGKNIDHVASTDRVETRKWFIEHQQARVDA